MPNYNPGIFCCSMASCSGTPINYDRLKYNFSLYTCLYRRAPADFLRLQSTAREAAGIVNLFISKKISDIYFKQVIVSQHMKEIYYLEMKKLLFEKTSMHLNQQLPAPHGHFCAKLLGDCSKVFNPEIFSCPTPARLTCKDLWCFMYTFRHKKCSSERRIFSYF